MEGISVFTEETPESLCDLATTWQHSKKTTIYKPGSRLLPDTEFAGALTLGFPASTTMRNEFLPFVSHPVYGILVIAA